jgi:hypothetical protein
MSEEQQDLERYVLEEGPRGVRLRDTVTGKTATYTGPDRLLNATTELNRLKAEDPERYVLEIGAVTVWIQDTVTGERVDYFTGPDRLLNATAKLNRLKAEEITAGTFITPEVAAKWLRQEDERWGDDEEPKLPSFSSRQEEAKQLGLKTPAFHRLQEEAKKLHLIEPSAFLADLTGYARRQRLTAMLKEVQEIETQAVALLADDARRLADATALRERLEKMLERTVSPLSEPLSDQQPAAQGLDVLVESGALKAFTGDAAQLFKPQPY